MIKTKVKRISLTSFRNCRWLQLTRRRRMPGMTFSWKGSLRRLKPHKKRKNQHQQSHHPNNNSNHTHSTRKSKSSTHKLHISKTNHYQHFGNSTRITNKNFKHQWKGDMGMKRKMEVVLASLLCGQSMVAANNGTGGGSGSSAGKNAAGVWESASSHPFTASFIDLWGSGMDHFVLLDGLTNSNLVAGNLRARICEASMRVWHAGTTSGGSVRHVFCSLLSASTVDLQMTVSGVTQARWAFSAVLLPKSINTCCWFALSVSLPSKLDR